MADDRPLGIDDLHKDVAHWYWCRLHRQPETSEYVDWEASCIRVGPFMSEREAQRLSSDPVRNATYQVSAPLGMEVER